MFSPVIISVEDPRRSQQRIPISANTHISHQNDVFPPTIDDKEVFRLSIASQQSSTTTTTLTSNSSSQRSSSYEDHVVAYASPAPSQSQQTVSIRQQPSSSRYLLENNLKNKFLSKFNNHSTPSSNRHQKSLSEPPPAINIMPFISSLEESTTNVIEIDPYLMCVKSAQELAIQSDHLQKYEQPTPSTFRFGKSWKKRLFILVDRIVFIFKSSKPTNPAREHFILTEDTFVFVTEEFKKGGYIIELRKPLMKWFIKCDTVQQLKIWLEAMKKIVACIKIGYDGLLTKMILASITLTDDYRILIPTNNSTAAPAITTTVTATPVESKKFNRVSLPAASYSSTSINTSSPLSNVTVTRNHSLNSNTPPARPPSRQQTKRQSLAEIPDWETTLPPQLPPPRSKPPPVPPLLPTVSE